MWKKTPTNVGHTGLQRKDYYYDGVRRIQEVINRPVLGQGGGEIEPLDLGTGEGNDELPVQMLSGSPPPQDLDPEPVPEPTVNEQWTDREYVYGPGYVDEFILQIDRYGHAIYMLQDANYNVVALVDASGLPLEQYTYDPYGTVLAADNVDENGPTAHAINRVGFQGLFFERYDGDYTQLCIAPNVAGMYYARNRFYSPTLGRFLQRDPNQTGLPIIAALAMNGEAASVLFGGFDAQSLYGDGMNLYLFAGANPVIWRDPSGLNSYAEQTTTITIGGILDGIVSWGCRLAVKMVSKVVGTALAYAYWMTVQMYAVNTSVWANGGPMVVDPAAASAFGDDLTRFANQAKDAGDDALKRFNERVKDFVSARGGGQLTPEDVWKIGKNAERALGNAPKQARIDAITTPAIERIRAGIELPHAHGGNGTWAINFNGIMKHGDYADIPEAAKLFLRECGWLIP